MGRLSLRKYLMSLKWAGLLLVPMVTYAAVRYDNLIIKGTQSLGTTAAPNSKALLDVVSTTKGFLEPRMSTVQRDAIAAVPLGLQVFNASTGFMNYYSTSWRELVDTDSTQVVSGKSVSGSTNTLTNIPAATAISGILPVVNGGTGLSTGTDGGLLGFIASGTISSSSSLTVNQLIKGGGAGATPSTFTACSNGQIVKWAGGIPACGTDSGASGVAYDSVTSTGSTSTANGVIALSGASFNLQLHTAVGNQGEILEIFHDGTSLTQAYTLLTTGGQTIGGVASGVYKLWTNGETLRLVSDNVNWRILTHKTDTDWISFTPDLSPGFGVVSLSVWFYQRQGKNMNIRGKFTSGSVQSSPANIPLPFAMLIDSTQVSTSESPLICLGWYGDNTTTATLVPATNKGPWPMFYNSADPTALYITNQVDTDNVFFVTRNVDAMWSGSNRHSMACMGIPISTWQP